jgi:hypothetical protein
MAAIYIRKLLQILEASIHFQRLEHGTLDFGRYLICNIIETKMTCQPANLTPARYGLQSSAGPDYRHSMIKCLLEFGMHGSSSLGGSSDFLHPCGFYVATVTNLQE